MLKNYFLVAWRNILKNKSFTAINIFGLAMSMSVCLLLILLVFDHYTYDSFHPKGDRTYRIISYQKGERGPFEAGYATSPLPMGEKLKTQYPFVEEVVNINHALRGAFRSSEKIIDLSNAIDGRSLFVSNNFFEVFGYSLKLGSPANALNDPYTMVLTTELEKLLFPNGNALGNTVAVDGLGTYTVTGVLDPPPAKSHLKFNALASFSSLPLLKNEGKVNAEYDHWDNLWMNYNYIVLSDNGKVRATTEALQQLATENIELEPEHPGYEFELQSLTEVVPGKLLGNEISFALPKIALLFFSILGLIVIITATINYTNLSIALSLTRVKEVAIRKTNGATKAQVICQFLLESVLISLLALGVAIGIYKFLIDQFNTMWIFSQLGITLSDTWYAYGFFLAFSILLGIVSGVGPAIFVNKMNTVSALKGGLLSSFKPKRGFSRFFSGKKILLGIQFSLSLIMLVTICLLQDQVRLLTSADYGFDDDKIYFTALQGHDPEIIATEFGTLPGIEEISFTSHHPATGHSYADGFKIDEEDEPITIYHFGVDESHIHTMGIKLIAGTNFPNSRSENEQFIVLNKLATERLGFDTPSSAIGEIITNEEGLALKIIGVVKDYHWEPLMKSIRPLMLRIQPERYKYAYFKVPNQNINFDQRVREKWLDFDPTREFQGGYLDAEINEFYRFMYDLGGILTYVALIAIVITLLGFLGMISFHLRIRRKEIGIRKVLGAGFGDVVLSMSKGFVIMLGFTAVVAVPLAILINSTWINEMAVHAPISWTNVGPPVLIIGILALGTIVTQVWKNMNDNPTEALRNE